MNSTSGSIVIIDLNRVYYKGMEIQGVVKVFIHRGSSLTLTVNDKSVVPVAELKAIGVKVKEVK